MYNIEKMRKKLKKYMDDDRYLHTEGVMYIASAMAMRYGEDIEKAMVAGLLHDCAKCMPDKKKIHLCEKNGIFISDLEQKNPFLLHGKAGACIARDKYQVRDEEILSAITFHTTGKSDMSLLEKIIYIADYIEPMRNKAPNLSEVRRLAFEDIDQALFKILSDTLEYLQHAPEKLDDMTKQAYEFYKKQTTV